VDPGGRPRPPHSGCGSGLCRPRPLNEGPVPRPTTGSVRSMTEAFELLREQTIPEINSKASLYRHRKTGAEVLSLENADENKVFGIAFKTIPEDSTGVAHILEHSVLCGSRKYRVKKPFVELIKGSL